VTFPRLITLIWFILFLAITLMALAKGEITAAAVATLGVYLATVDHIRS
jgi:hypothetical protein